MNCSTHKNNQLKTSKLSHGDINNCFLKKKNSIDYIMMNCGRVHLITGPMYSGKTSELIRLINRYEITGKTCLLVKYIHDDRYDKNCIVTHDGKKLFALPCSALQKEVIPFLNEYDVIGIDEGQFFVDLVDFCEHAAQQGKIVLVAALDGTFMRKPFTAPQFADMPVMFSIADQVTKLHAVCMQCKQKDAPFTHRTNRTCASIKSIGSTDKYMSVCRACYMSLNK